MAGLLQKDLYILAQRKNSILIFLVICCVMAASMDGSFIVGYTVMLSMILSISTIAYDEADNGLLFLMTLPVDTRSYARSKYLFAFLLSCISWILSLILMFGANMVKGIPVNPMEDLGNALAILLVFLIALNVMIPLQLKFGAEKSRLVLALIAGIIVALSVAARSIGVISDETPAGIAAVLDTLSNTSPAILIGVVLVFDIIATAISIRISEKVVADKEL